MYAKSLPLLLSFALLGCANNSSKPGSCGSGTEAIATNAGGIDANPFSKFLHEDAKIARYIAGGYIDVKFYTKKGTDEKVVNYETQFNENIEEKWKRCTILLGFNSGEAKGKMRIFTSDHCIGLSSAADFKLQVYLEIDGKPSYVPLSITSDKIDAISNFRKETLNLEPAARERFLTTFDTGTTVDVGGAYSNRTGVETCRILHQRSVDLAKNKKTSPDYYASLISEGKNHHACFSMHDLVSLNVRATKPYSSFSAVEKLALENSEQNYYVAADKFGLLKKNSGFLQKFAFETARTMMEDFQDRNMRIRHFLNVENYLNLLDNDMCSENKNIACDAETIEKLTSLSKKYFPNPDLSESEANRWFESSVKGDASLSSIIRKGVASLATSWLSGKGNMVEKQQSAAAKIWQLYELPKALYEFNSKFVSGSPKLKDKIELFNKMMSLSLHSNFRNSINDQESKFRWVSPGALPDDKNNLSLKNIEDPTKDFTSITSYNNKDPFGRVVVISYRSSKVGKNSASIQFESTDSGSLLANSIFPFATLSTLDGVPTEGVVLRPLPTGAGDNEIAASIPQSNSPGSNATKTSPSANKEVAASVFKQSQPQYVGTGNLPSPSEDRVKEISASGSNATIDSRTSGSSRFSSNCN